MSTLWDSIKKGAHIAAEKAEELSKKSKVMLEISSIKSNIEKNFTELGGKVYHLIHEENATQVELNEDIQKVIKTIDKYEKELKKSQDKLESINIAYKTKIDFLQEDEK